MTNKENTGEGEPDKLLIASDFSRPETFTELEQEWPGPPLEQNDPRFIQLGDGNYCCRSEPNYFLLLCSRQNISPRLNRIYRVTATARLVRRPTNGRQTNFQVAILGRRTDGQEFNVYAHAEDLSGAKSGTVITSSQILVCDQESHPSVIKARVLCNYWRGTPFSDALYEVISLEMEDITSSANAVDQRVSRLERIEGNAPLIKQLQSMEKWSDALGRRNLALEEKVQEIERRFNYQISTLNMQMGSFIDALTPLVRGNFAPDEEKKAAIGQISRLKSQRRELRERQLMPTGHPGPVEGIHVANGTRPVLFVVFAGRSDILGTLPALSSLGYNVIYVTDDTNSWYVNGIAGARSIPEMVEALRVTISGYDVNKVVFFGQSMGAYAALRFAPDFKPDMVAAWCPQTRFVSGPVPPGVQRNYIDSNAPDIRKEIIASQLNTHIWVSLSEAENPEKAFWDDYAHLEGLDNSPHIKIHKVNCHQHSIGLALAQAGRITAALETVGAMVMGEEPAMSPDAFL